MQAHERLGATYRSDNSSHFLVWAPNVENAAVVIEGPEAQTVPLARDERGYHRGDVAGVRPGARYRYRLNGEKERPDPASRFQPEGVHGPSEVTDSTAFVWHDAVWPGLPLERYVIYELHVGTFTAGGTFDAVISHLDTLKELGVTAIEIMPVAQFPGDRNWGYDGVDLFAVQNSYGGPEGLMRLVDACHARGLAVVLDVVYNHFGPEGNYLWDYAPYFTDRYTTPWGDAVNFDGPWSDEVRRFFIENAVQWFEDFHIDALRLDAIHAIKDFSAYPFLRELADIVHARAEQAGRPWHLIAESDMNDPRVIRPADRGGHGLDAQWSDDFHHALHVLLTSEQDGYYEDFIGITDLARAYRESFVRAGEYSRHRKRRHGSRALPALGRHFVVCAQNHDQVGNRATGERLSETVSYDALKLAAAAVLLSPYVPLLFMGEEYGETAPFQFFVSHGDAALIEAVRQGRRAEFGSFDWQGAVPDPQDPATFARSKLTHREHEDGPHRTLWLFYQELLRLRAALPALASLDLESIAVSSDEGAKTLAVHRWAGDNQILAVFNFSDAEQRIETYPLPNPDSGYPLGGRGWAKVLDSADARWNGQKSVVPGILIAEGGTVLTLQPLSLALFVHE